MHFPTHQSLAAALCLLALLASTTCDKRRKVTEHEQQTVEVAPGEFLTLSRVDELGESRFVHGTRNETTALTIPWDGKDLHWKGYEIPSTLRAWEHKLYMITFDRHTDSDKPRLKYYQQNDAGNGFDEIPPTSFPKKIASQNMWFNNPNDYLLGEGGRKYNEVDMALQLDPEDPYFVSTLTARIWCELEGGFPYHEQRKLRYEEKRELMQKFAAANKPIKLTKIIDRTTTAPTTLPRARESSN
jgi:hypothetical protein